MTREELTLELARTEACIEAFEKVVDGLKRDRETHIAQRDELLAALKEACVLAELSSEGDALDKWRTLIARIEGGK